MPLANSIEMTRREFSRTVRVAVIKRSTRAGVIYCECCGEPARRFQIDHVIADACGGKPILENAELICDQCFKIKNPLDTTKAAKIKRQEAGHLGAKKPSTLKSRGFDHKPKPEKLPMPKPIPMYVKD